MFRLQKKILLPPHFQLNWLVLIGLFLCTSLPIVVGPVSFDGSDYAAQYVLSGRPYVDFFTSYRQTFLFLAGFSFLLSLILSRSKDYLFFYKATVFGVLLHISWLVINTFLVAPNVQIALWGSLDFREGALSWLCYDLILLGTMVHASDYRIVKLFKSFFTVFFLFVALILFTEIYFSKQYFWLYSRGDPSKVVINLFSDKHAATLYHPNYLGFYAAISLVFFGHLLFLKLSYFKFIFSRSSLTYLICTLLSLWIGYQSGSKSSIFAVFGCFLFWLAFVLFSKGRKLFLSFCFLFLAIGVTIIALKRDYFLKVNPPSSFPSSFNISPWVIRVALDDFVFFNIEIENDLLKFYDSDHLPIMVMKQDNGYRIVSKNFNEILVKIENAQDQKTRLFIEEKDKKIIGDYVWTEKGLEKEIAPGFFRVCNDATNWFPWLNDGIASRRSYIWKQSFGLFMKRPLQGYGSGHFPLVFPFDCQVSPYIVPNGQYIDKAHSFYLRLLVEQGLIGSFIVFYIIMSIFLNLKKTILRDWPNQKKWGPAVSVVIVFLIMGLSHDSFVGLTPIFFVFLGFLGSKSKVCKLVKVKV